jgi:hypothetical protein
MKRKEHRIVNLLDLVRDGMALIQDVESTTDSMVEIGKQVGVMGTAVVKVIQSGRQAVTYLITRRQAEAPPEPVGSVELTPIPDEAPLVESADVALVVDINRRIVQDVARYLDEQGIEADLVVLTNTPDYGDTIEFLDSGDPDAWAELVREFNEGLTRIKRAVGGARIHVFLATPLPLAFGLGAVWGTVDRATVYHWEDSTYHPVMKISRDLRVG